MEIKVAAPFEPLAIEIGNTVVNTSIDMSFENFIKLEEVSAKAKDKMKNLEKLRDDAMKTNDKSKVIELNAKLAKVIEPVVKAAIGEDDYSAILLACGNGKEISKATCNLVFAQVVKAIFETMKAYGDNFNGKAAHYLSEVDSAQAEPNQAI